MCGRSSSKLRDKDVEIYLGAYGGSLQVGDVYFESKNDYEEGTRVWLGKQDMLVLLKQHTPDELARMIVGIVRNAKEG